MVRGDVTIRRLQLHCSPESSVKPASIGMSGKSRAIPVHLRDVPKTVKGKYVVMPPPVRAAFATMPRVILLTFT